MRLFRFSRRFAAVMLAGICGLLFCACARFPSALPAASPTPDPSPTVSPTPSPSPAPRPYLAVFGAEESSAFQEGITNAAETGAYAVVFESGSLDALRAYKPAGSCVAIVLLRGQDAALPETSFPVFVFASEGQRVDPGIPHLTYAGVYAAETALSLAVSYPPHETPVRLIGLFSSEESDAYAILNESAAEGRIFSKAKFFLTTSPAKETPEPEQETPLPSLEPALEERLSALFSRFYPGMIDGVFAETGELAVVAAETLASLDRSDIEVFSASTTADAQNLLSPLLVACVGANYAEAGGLCYSAASALLDGEAVSSLVMLPQTFSYSPEP